MSRPLIAALVILSFGLTLPSEAALSSRVHHPKTHRGIKHSLKPKVQQHYSFIPAYKPLEAVAKLQTPLTGRVVKEIQAASVPSSPRYTQIFLTPEQQAALAASNKAQPIQPMAVQSKVVHHSWRWLSFGSNRPQKFHIQPEMLTTANSYVAPISSADAAQLSGLITLLIQEQVPDVKTNLILAAVPTSQSANPLTLTLQYNLKNLGYALDSDSTKPSTAVRYRVSLLDKDILLRVKINGTETARLYQHSYSGTLAAASPLTRFNRREP